MIKLLDEPAFRDGECLPLNAANSSNAKYGRINDEQPSGHWLYSFLRYDVASGQRFLVVVNLSPTTAMNDVSVMLDQRAFDFLGFGTTEAATQFTFAEKLGRAEDSANATCSLEEALRGGIPLGDIPAATPLFFEIKTPTPTAK